MLKTKKISFFVMLTVLIFCTVMFSQEEKDADGKLKARLFEALERDNGELARKLLEAHPRLVTAQRRGGWTPLHMCARVPQLTEYLIKKGADVHAPSDGGWTPLHSHAYYGTPEGIGVLLRHGAKINQKNAFGMTPIMNAVRWNKHENLKLLAEKGAELNVADLLGRTPLINASIQGFSEMTGILIKMGADITVADRPTKGTALHFAACQGHLEIVKQLVAGQADINTVDSKGRSPLFYAARYGHRKVADFLKSSGAKGKADRSRFGPSPLLKKKIPGGEASVWFLGRIGYGIKTAGHFLVFSYYDEGNLPAERYLSGGYLTVGEIKEQNVTVFAGAARYHHHTPKRYRKWQDRLEKVRFIYSFEDKVGTRHPHYQEDVPGPDYIHLPPGTNKKLDGMTVTSFPISSRGTGFLVEVDGLVICHTGDLFVFGKSQMETYRETLRFLKNSGKRIDILFQMGVFPYGRIIEANVQALDESLTVLQPRSLFLMGAQHCEYLLEEVKKSLKKHESYTKIISPQHQGDRFYYKKAK